MFNPRAQLKVWIALLTRLTLIKTLLNIIFNLKKICLSQHKVRKLKKKIKAKNKGAMLCFSKQAKSTIKKRKVI